MRSWGLGMRQGQLSAGSDLNRAPIPWVKTDSKKRPKRVLTSGSDLNKTATGPFPPLIDSGLIQYKAGNSAWPPNRYRTFEVTRTPANYGQNTSVARFGFRGWEFPTNVPGQLPSIGFLPGPIPEPHRPMWNVLTQGALYRMRVVNPTTAKAIVQRNANAYSLSGGTYSKTASLSSITFKGGPA
jgi:hypothetical protein